MGVTIVSNKIVGKMPNGETMEFDCFSDYENAYYDMLYEMNNGYSTVY